MSWESTFQGVHHLKGVDTRLKIWIEEFDSGGCCVRMTEAGTFSGKSISRYCETLQKGKEEGERLSTVGFTDGTK